MGNGTEDLNHEYRSAIAEFRVVAARSLAASLKFRAIDGGGRRYWASVLFLRVVLMSGSISRLLPDIDTPGMSDWWDFASIACLQRTAFECLMFFRYFTERCGDDEWNAKLNVMQLHDCSERIRIFTLMKKEEDVDGFRAAEQELRRKLEDNAYFQALNPNLRKTIEQGYRASIPTLREIVAKYIPDSEVWIIYQFLSNYTHSFPMSFYRTYEQSKFGPENEADKLYFTTSISWFTPLLAEALNQYEEGHKGILGGSNQVKET